MKRELVFVSKFQNEILELMKEKDTYSNKLWGFSAMGFREIARMINKKHISVSNSMRAMMKKGIFFNSTAEDQWDDTTYFLVNPEISKERGNYYRLKNVKKNE